MPLQTSLSQQTTLHSSSSLITHNNLPSANNYTTKERHPYKWKGFSLAPFDRSGYLRFPKELDGIFWTAHHHTEFTWLTNYYSAQIKDIEAVHGKELRLLNKKRSITLKRCRVKEKAVRAQELDISADVLRFQQLWEKSIVYCRLKIELHNLRVDSRRTLLGKPVTTGAERTAWAEAFLSQVRKEQWLTLLNVRAAFVKECLVFPEHLRAPFGQTLESYFKKFGIRSGWYRASDLVGAIDGARSRVWSLAPHTFSASTESEDGVPWDRSFCARLKRSRDFGKPRSLHWLVGIGSSLGLLAIDDTMHFPTSLPRSTRSPSARMSVDPRLKIPPHSVHSDPYDGPIPTLPKTRPRPPYGKPQYRRKPSLGAAPIAPITSVYSFSARASSNGTDPRIGPTLQRISNGTDSGSSPYNPGSNNPSVPNVDGAGKLLSAPNLAKSKLKGMGVGKMFGKKKGKPNEDPDDSPTEASEFYELKRKKSEKAAKGKGNPLLDTAKSASSSRARLAAKLLRHRGKTGAIETGLDLDDSDHHPFDAAKKRLDDQRERKMRRKSAGSKSSEHSKGTSPPEERYQPRRTGSASTRQEVRFANPREQLDAYRASRVEEKAEVEEEGSRMGNAVRKLSAHLSRNEEEAQAGARRASWASAEEQKVSRYADTSSSSSLDEAPLQVPRAADVPDLSPPPAPGFMKNNQQMDDSSQMEPHSNSLPYGSANPQRGNPYSQVMFPPKPPAPFFRPTLSPVSSRSPVPTSVGPVATSPRRSIEKKAVSSSPRMQPIEQDPSASSVHLPLSEVGSAPTPPKKLTIRNGAPTVSSTHDSDNSSPESAVLSPIIEQETPEYSSRRSSQRSTEPPKPTAPPPPAASSEEAVSSLNLEHDTKPNHVPPSLVREKSNGSSAISNRFSEILRPQQPPPQPSPSPLKIAPQTPTPSALEFWREADSSLAPSESASAQPPNFHGLPPPRFWKAADLNLDTRRELGPTMEEWIATLPGLGLGLGSWGNNDGALDWKYFQALKASNKLKKSRSASSVGTQKSAKDMIVENLQVMEMVIEGVEERHREELEEGLTPDEAEALELEAPATVPVVDNLPPPVNEPGLLHPEYRLVTGAGRILSGRRPQSRRGKDVAGRLDDMERYWAEQSLVMGTVLKRMLVVVDGLIVKEREQAQKEQRRVEMGWVDEGEVESLNVGTPREGEEAWGCSVA